MHPRWSLVTSTHSRRLHRVSPSPCPHWKVRKCTVLYVTLRYCTVFTLSYIFDCNFLCFAQTMCFYLSFLFCLYLSRIHDLLWFLIFFCFLWKEFLLLLLQITYHFMLIFWRLSFFYFYRCCCHEQYICIRNLHVDYLLQGINMDLFRWNSIYSIRYRMCWIDGIEENAHSDWRPSYPFSLSDFSSCCYGTWGCRMELKQLKRLK